MRQAAFHAPRQQRGFSAVFAAIAMVAMLSATALAIDVGRLYSANRSLQRAASLAALDAVQVVSGCTGRGVTGTVVDARAEALASLARNGLAVDSVVTQIGMRDGSAALTGFVALADGDARISAVRVTLTRAAPDRILPLITGSRDLVLQASAAAGQAPQAGVALGPSVLALNSANSPLLNSLLGEMLGGAVNLSVASAQGLAAAQVKLVDLAAAAGVATPNGLVDLDLSLPGALRLLADALDETGGAVNASAAATLDRLAAAADPNRNVLLGNVLQIGENLTGDAADTLYVDAFSLLMALSQSAVEGQTLDLPLGVALPQGLANLHLMVKVLRAPQIVGPGPAGTGQDGRPLTYARTAAVQLQLRTDLLDVSGALAGLSPLVGVVAQPIRLGLDVDLGSAEASIREIQCPSMARPDTTVDVGVETALANVRLGTFAGAAAAAPPLAGGALINAVNLPLLGPVLSVTLAAPARLEVGAAEQADTTFVNDFPLYVELPTPTNPRLIGDEALLGSAGSSLSTQFAAQLDVRLLGVPLPVGQLLSLASQLLTPVFQLLDSVVDPLLSLLGVQPGASNVELYQVKVPRAEIFATD